ncbi:MAG: 2'-deoxycytidine 5'-triphosphate deaminase [Nanoarchaeota archaeon]|nr:2'-deoxycytidine 5'-triphosphate deaminase [Nanoarchaeota archaeon]
MSPDSNRGYCLVSQQIRDKIERGEIVIRGDFSKDERGWFKDDDLEGRVQPSSFEPIIGDEGFILDTERLGGFRPQSNQTVYRALLELPRRQRLRVNMSGGFIAQTGFTYLFPLEERVTLKKGDRMKSSPKSSTGRLFPKTRLIADYTPNFDSVNHVEGVNDPLQLWLLFQPTSFNIILYPGDILNQLRFFQGTNASLSQEEIIEEFTKNPLLYKKVGDDELVPTKPVITDDGLQINLDLTGQNTYGIVGLRARDNPKPIEIGKEHELDPEEFFEPVTVKRGKVRFYEGERYLLATAGVMNIPPHLCGELRRHFGLGLRAVWDEAGYFDNGFKGNGVLEATPQEEKDIELDQGDTIPCSALELFRTSETPDKLYGTKEAKSHYYEQLGPKVSKHFKPFDFARAAKDYQKLNRDVLVHDARVLMSFREARDGFEPIRPEVAERIVREIERNGFFHSRYDCEDDEEVLQPIPYVLLFGSNGTVFTYVRATNIRDYGDERLFGKYSIGLGGHIIRADRPNFVINCLEREVIREEVKIEGDHSKPKLVGTLMAYDKPVDRVHFGLIYTIHTNGNIISNESSITSFGMMSFDKLAEKIDPFETWSRVLVPLLPELYKR